MIRKERLIRRCLPRCTRDEKRCASRTRTLRCVKEIIVITGNKKRGNSAFGMRRSAARKRSYFYLGGGGILPGESSLEFHLCSIRVLSTRRQHRAGTLTIVKDPPLREDIKRTQEITTRRFVRDDRSPTLLGASPPSSPKERIIRPSKQIMEKRSPPARKLCDDRLIVGGCATTDDQERERDRARGATAPLRPPRCPIDRGTLAGGGRCCSEIRLLVAGAITSRCNPLSAGVAR